MNRPVDGDKNKRGKPWWQAGWVRIFVTSVLLAWLISTINWEDLGAEVAHLDWRLAALACGVYVVNRWFTTLKWWVLLHAKGLRYPMQQLLRVVFVSNFLGHFLPSSVGGDNIRMLTMARESKRAPEAISTVVMERITGSASLGILALMGGVWSYANWGKPAVMLAILLPAAALLAVIALILTTPGYALVSGVLARLHQVPGQAFIAKVHEATQSYRHQLKAVWVALAVSVVIQVNRVIAVFLLARALQLELYFGEALVLVPTALFIGALPISIGGLGVRESAFVVLLGVVGIGKDQSFGLSLMTRLAQMASNLPGALFLLTHGVMGKEAVTARETIEGPIRVLRVIDKLGYADRMHGPGRQLLRNLNRFDPKRCRVAYCVLRLHPVIAEQFAEQGIPLIHLKKRRFDPLTILALMRLIREQRADVVHLSGYGSTTFGRIAAAMMGVPAITHHHDLDDGLPWYVACFDWLLAPLSVRAIAVADAVAQTCARKRFISKSRIVVIHNTVDAEWIGAADPAEIERARAGLGIPEGVPVIGSVTRLRAEKDVPTFIRALARLRDQGWKGVAVIVGDGPDRAALEDLVRGLKLEPQVRWAGFQKDPRAYMGLMQVAVCSSRTEGFGNVLVEKMAMGKPVVATASGGMKEILRDGVNGLMVPVGDDRALAAAIWRLLGDAALAGRLSAQACEDAKAYLIPKLIERLEILYEDVVHQRRGADKSGRGT